jgi:hypothetical protein
VNDEVQQNAEEPKAALDGPGTLVEVLRPAFRGGKRNVLAALV